MPISALHALEAIGIFITMVYRPDRQVIKKGSRILRIRAFSARAAFRDKFSRARQFHARLNVALRNRIA